MVLKTNGLLDVIAEKTRGMNARIIVQQDNAKPHTGLKNREIINEVAVSRGMNIEFMNQPPQSPDLNRLDLCFFHSLNKQRELIRRRCKTNEELIEVCSAAFNDYSDAKLRRVYALQFVVYREVLKHSGYGGFEIPHTNIRQRQQLDELTTVDYVCPNDLVLSARNALRALI